MPDQDPPAEASGDEAPPAKTPTPLAFDTAKQPVAPVNKTTETIVADAEEPETVDEAILDEGEALELLPVSEVHPSAAHGTTAESIAEGKEEYGEYFIGMWGNTEKPNYGCPYCTYSSIEGPGDVELHILGKIDGGDLSHLAALETQEA